MWCSLISGVALLLLIFRELHFNQPILDLRIFKKPAFFDRGVADDRAPSFLLFGTGLLLPIFLQDLMGYSAWKAGLV